MCVCVQVNVSVNVEGREREIGYVGWPRLVDFRYGSHLFYLRERERERERERLRLIFIPKSGKYGIDKHK